jgi:ribose transport system substrate-binding protein
MSGYGSSHRWRNSRKSLGAIAALLTGAALVLAACSSGSSASPGSDKAASKTATAADLEKAKALLASIKSPSAISFPAGATPVKPGVHKVAVIVAGLGSPGASTLAPYVIQAVKAIGWTSPPAYDGKFTTSIEAQDIEDALNGGAQALFLIAVTPASVQSALAPALTKKMPVICLECGGPTDAGNLPGVVDVEDSTTLAGQLQAAYGAVESGGHGEVALFNDPEYPNITDRYEAALAALKLYCPACTIITQNVTLAQELAPGMPEFTGFLTSHPSGTVNYIITPDDSAAAMWSQAAEQAGRTDIKFVGYAALPPNYGYISAGSPPGAAASVVIPVPYYGWAGVDEAARLFNHMPTWSAINLPDVLVTKSNAATFTSFAKANGGVAGFAPPNFEANFEKLWGRPTSG